MTVEEKLEMWQNQPTGPRVLDAILSRLAVIAHKLGNNIRHVLYRLVSRFFFIFFKLQNRLRIYGQEKIPKKGCIFYLNHPGSYDPLILMAANPYQTGAFVSWGNGWFMDMIEQKYGYISRLRIFKGKEMLEKMIRQILCNNRHFAIWPEGHPTKHGYVKEGFSSVAKLYATINAKDDKVPFMPVLIRGSGIYLYDVGIKRGPIEINFLDPFFLPREWLKKPAHGGKTAREITNYLMNLLARKLGQKNFIYNTRLERRRAYFRRKAKRSKEK